MTGALAAAPQINALLYIDPAYQALGVARSPTGPVEFTEDYRDDPRVPRTKRWGSPAHPPARSNSPKTIAMIHGFIAV